MGVVFLLVEEADKVSVVLMDKQSSQLAVVNWR